MLLQYKNNVFPIMIKFFNINKILNMVLMMMIQPILTLFKMVYCLMLILMKVVNQMIDHYHLMNVDYVIIILNLNEQMLINHNPQHYQQHHYLVFLLMLLLLFLK